MKMKKFIYLLPLLVVLFFQKENLKMTPSQEKPKPKTEKNLAQRMYGGSVGNRRIF